MEARRAYARRWPRRNLGELANFLDRMHPGGYSLRDVSERTGLTCQDISGMFSRDDAKLSKAERVAAAYGYRLRLFFPQKEYAVVTSYRREFPGAGNLSGLLKYIYDSNISLHRMSERLGRTGSVLYRAFGKGDVMLSVLYSMLGDLGIQVLWEFERTDGAGRGAETENETETSNETSKEKREML